MVEAQLVPGEQVDLLGPLGLTLAHNEGVAFGLAGGSGAAADRLRRRSRSASSASCSPATRRGRGCGSRSGCVAGGALGNLADRLRAGEVTDYIEIGSWPPFNLADVAITVGVAVFALIFLREEGR